MLLYPGALPEGCLLKYLEQQDAMKYPSVATNKARIYNQTLLSPCFPFTHSPVREILMPQHNPSFTSFPEICMGFVNNTTFLHRNPELFNLFLKKI